MLLFVRSMQTDAIPWKVLSSRAGVGVLTDGWTLDEAACEPDSARAFRFEVQFASSFLTAPVVHLGLTGFDLDQRNSSRLTLNAEQITEHGFVAVISTWADTRVFAVEFNWLAIGA